MLTVLTVSSALVLTLIILVPVRPSRENAISMPRIRRNVCARRSRPASARGFFAHALPLGSASYNGGANTPARNSSGQVIGGGAVVTGPGNSVVERRDRVINRENDLTTGRADRGGCTTQTYRVPSEGTGDLTSVGVTRC